MIFISYLEKTSLLYKLLIYSYMYTGEQKYMGLSDISIKEDYYKVLNMAESS